MGEWHYDDEDVKRLSMIMTLYETDFSKEDIDEYMQLILSGENDEECLKILSQKRKKALDKINILERQISNLDYLKNEIKNNNQEEFKMVKQTAGRDSLGDFAP